MKIYISGPITGISEYKKRFDDAEEFMKNAGYEVINPIAVCIDMTGASWSDCMKRDIVALMGCDAIYAMKGWENSKGATIEVGLARALELIIVEEQ